MTTPPRRMIWLFMAMVVALGSAAAWAWSVCGDARDQARVAAQALQDSRGYAQAIVASGGVGGPGSAQLSEVQMRLRVADAAEAAEIDGSESLIQIDPARIAAQGTAREMSTTIRLQKVTLEELFGFCVALNAPPVDEDHPAPASLAPLAVQRIRLVAPREMEIGEVWNVEVTLACPVKADAPAAPAGAALTRR